MLVVELVVLAIKVFLSQLVQVDLERTMRLEVLEGNLVRREAYCCN